MCTYGLVSSQSLTCGGGFGKLSSCWHDPRETIVLVPQSWLAHKSSHTGSRWNEAQGEIYSGGGKKKEEQNDSKADRLTQQKHPCSVVRGTGLLCHTWLSSTKTGAKCMVWKTDRKITALYTPERTMPGPKTRSSGTTVLTGTPVKAL